MQFHIKFFSSKICFYSNSSRFAEKWISSIISYNIEIVSVYSTKVLPKHSNILTLRKNGISVIIEIYLLKSSIFRDVSAYSRHIYIKTEKGFHISIFYRRLQGVNGIQTHFSKSFCMLFYRQYRTKIVRQMRRQIFRQMKQKAEWILDVFTSIFVKYDGKFASRWRAKSPDALCAVLPNIFSCIFV